MRQYEPDCNIPYLTLVSEMLRDFRDLHSRLDIFDRFGKDCLTDITDCPQTKTNVMVRSWPKGSEEKVFQFKDSDKRWGFLNVIFYKGRLVNFRAQLFFQGWFAKSRALRFQSLKMHPLMKKISGLKSIHHDYLNDTYSCHDVYGLKITFRYLHKTRSISTTIAAN